MKQHQSALTGLTRLLKKKRKEKNKKKEKQNSLPLLTSLFSRISSLIAIAILKHKHLLKAISFFSLFYSLQSGASSSGLC
jgi:hypothetical protein